jgi:hypothetical protein
MSSNMEWREYRRPGVGSAKNNSKNKNRVFEKKKINFFKK